MRAASSVSWTLALVLIGLSACSFEPTFPEGAISCRTERDCPPSYECVSSTCYSRDLVRDGSLIDAPKIEVTLDGAAGSTAGTGGDVGTAGAGGETEPSDGAAGGDVASAGGTGGGGATGGGGGGGSTGCGSTCTLGAKRCGANGLETCIMVGTCPAFGAGVACPGRQTCQGAAPNGACVCPTAPTGCTGKGTTCEGMAARTCDVDTEGCVYVKSAETCTAGKPCAGTFPTAACTCPAPPAACGGKVGTACSGTTSVVTCALDANGCLAITQTTPCAAAKPCAVSGGFATCSCGAPPAECAAGAGGVCRANGQLATCALDGDGCLAVTAAGACMGTLTCQGAAPNGACNCPAAPALCNGGTGTFCDATGKVATCARDASNCLVITTTASCAGAQTCQGGAGTAACACPALPAACPGGAGKLCNASGQLVTCVADVKGCVSVGSTLGCGSGLVCAGAFPSAACVCPTPPAGCNGTTGTFCSGNSTFTCSRDANNCLVASGTTPCGSGLVCGGAAGSASCQCPAAPAACMGAQSGNVCQTATTYVTCGKDANGCVVVTSSAGTCPGGSKPCAGSPGAAACTCNTTPNAACSPGGAFQSGFACSGAQRLQCSTDANGCQTSTAPSSCTAPQTCSGALPTAACTCPAGYNPPECDAAGEIDGSRCVGSTLTTCTNAGAGCQSLSTTTCASNQLCVGAYPSARCADEEKKGVTTAGGGVVSWSSTLVGNKINVPVQSTLKRFGLVWAGNGSGAALSRLTTFALYKDNGSGPNGALLASAIDRTVNALGPTEFNLTSPAGGLTLAAGDYWMFVNINMAGYVAQNTSPSTTTLTASATYGGALPATVTNASFSSGPQPGPLGFYLVVIPQQ